MPARAPKGGLIAEHFGVPHIATGDLLRDHVSRETDLGRSLPRPEVLVIKDVPDEEWVAFQEALAEA